jgi:DMSO/TMAO reductase YedYZ molybdopterin-dependent catalytic subunit/thiosulfate reductase cytochrome b subunit
MVRYLQYRLLMIAFDAAHRAVHYPADRRVRIWIRPSILAGLAVILAAVIAAAWLQVALFGLPAIPQVPSIYATSAAAPHGFPLWVRYCHFFNFLFVMLLLRSGLSILVDHPRLYFNDDCTPGSEWIRITPLTVPRDRLWTAKDDARYISPLVGTPGYRHSIGVARSWHFITVHGFVLTGLIYAVMLFATERWRRLVPTSTVVLSQAWSTWVHYATFNLPPEPNGFFGYNALQQIAYFSVFFIFGPVAILTGIAMSPAVVNRFRWNAQMFGGRQAARSIHFLTMIGFAGFIVVHVTLIAMTGLVRNMNHIVIGTDDQSHAGVLLGVVGLTVVVLTWVAAHYISWHHPRALQRAQKMVTYPMQVLTLDRFDPREHYTDRDISPFFWPNGKAPTRDDWSRLAEGGFRDYKLQVGGLVDRPVELTLADIERMGGDDHVALHHCIQGWSGIARWSGLPMKALVELVHPKPEARVVAFYSYGEALYGGAYYDTQRLEDVLKPQCMLATRMNGAPLSGVYGAPLRLRVENQLGYKMVKWIERIEFVVSEKELGKGEGGSNEDEEYFDLLPNV